MISEKDANLARDQYSDKLTALGAHAIAVDEMIHNEEKTFGVVAFVEQKSAEIPAYLTLRKGAKTFKVPVKVQVAEKFKPE